MAIKWIEVYAGSSGSEAMPNGFSSKERWRALCAEWGALLTVRSSLLRGAEGDADAFPPTPAAVTLEDVNVVIGLALHGNGLSHNDVRALMARTAPPLEEVRCFYCLWPRKSPCFLPKSCDVLVSQRAVARRARTAPPLEEVRLFWLSTA